LASSEYESSDVERWIARLAQGDETAREELLGGACERLRRLARKMLRDFPDVQRWEQTDDVCQNALLRLWRSLARVPVVDARHFFRLAALHIRRELIDLVRRYHGPEGPGAAHATQPPWPGDGRAAPHYDRAELSYDPQRLADWGDFHERVEQLPEEQREVFDLLWYHGLTQDEAAVLLHVNVRTIKRRWRDARLHLHEVLGNDAFQ
jgi:RNA polymerase sigma-70 factor (ECF subfamily)